MRARRILTAGKELDRLVLTLMIEMWFVTTGLVTVETVVVVLQQDEDEEYYTIILL